MGGRRRGDTAVSWEVEEKECVNVTALPSVFDRQLSGSQRFYLSAITALESFPTISALEAMKLYRPCLTSLQSHD